MVTFILVQRGVRPKVAVTEVTWRKEQRGEREHRGERTAEERVERAESREERTAEE